MNNFIRLTLLLATLLLPAAAFSAESLLWKIEKKNEPVSYLLGTMHMGKNGDRLAPAVLKALGSSAVVILESNGRADNPEVAKVSAQLVDLKNPLSAKLGKELFDSVAAKVPESVATKAQLKLMRPFAVLPIITIAANPGYSVDYGIEMLVTAAAAGKPEIYLESVPEAIAYFTSLPDDKIIRLIGYYVDNWAEISGTSIKIVDAYRQNNVKKATDLTDDSMEYGPEEDREFWRSWAQTDLLKERNKKWMPAIIEQLPKQSNFIAVGALHLFNDDGLITLLRDKGYSVSPVNTVVLAR